MPKTKIKLKEEKKNYLCIAVGIFLSIICILMIGRVGSFDSIFLIFSILFGDFSIFVLLFIIIYSVKDLVLNKKVDLHHIFFFGAVLIYLGLSVFAHLGLYDALMMTNTSVLTKTAGLYSRYFKHFEHGYSCGGGIIVALILQVVMFIGGKIGAILLAIGCIAVGICYIIDFKFFKLFRGGKLRQIPMTVFTAVKSYFKNMHYPKASAKTPKIPLSILMDNEEAVNFTLQQEINRERFEQLKEFITKNHIYCVCDGFETSYTSSRFILKLAHKSENTISEISGFFNKCCFFIRNDLLVYVEISNQFKKLLTLKSVLLAHLNQQGIVLGIDVDNKGIELDITQGKTLCVLGDATSGVKTFIRCFLASLIFKGYSPEDIYFYDLYHEFAGLGQTKIHYINNERSTSISFDEAFSEYERRSEVLKYLNVDTVAEANKKIKSMGSEYEEMRPIFHFIFFNSNLFDSSMLQKLSYVMQFGVKVDMILCIVIKDKSALSKINLGNCDILSFHLADVTTSVKLFGCDIACRLQKKGDVLYQSKNKIYHGQAPYISLDDFDKIIDRL